MAHQFLGTKVVKNLVSYKIPQISNLEPTMHLGVLNAQCLYRSLFNVNCTPHKEMVTAILGNENNGSLNKSKFVSPL